MTKHNFLATYPYILYLIIFLRNPLPFQCRPRLSIREKHACAQKICHPVFFFLTCRKAREDKRGKNGKLETLFLLLRDREKSILYAATMVTEKEKKKIRALWRTPSFAGSFSGLANFRTSLATEKDIHLSHSELFNIMKEDENFILETKKRVKRFKRREMVVHGFATVWQADIGDMFQFNKVSSFLCCVDIFSRNIYCRMLRTKKSIEVQKKFLEIFEGVGMKPHKLETDRGSEFQGSKAFFLKEKIVYKVKVGANKASFAEHGIQVRNFCFSTNFSCPTDFSLVQMVKRRLYRLCRTLKTKNWPKYLNRVTRAINNSPNSAIGHLKPSEIKSPLDDPKVDNAIGLPQDVSFAEQQKNQAKYEKERTNLQTNDYVYLDFPPSTMEKSFDSPVSFF